LLDDPLHPRGVEVIERGIQVKPAEIESQLGAEVDEQALGAGGLDQLAFTPAGLRGRVADHEPGSLEEEQVVRRTSVGDGSPADVAGVLARDVEAWGDQEHAFGMAGGEVSSGL
jgi:hypothetical protein